MRVPPAAATAHRGVTNTTPFSSTALGLKDTGTLGEKPDIGEQADPFGLDPNRIAITFQLCILIGETI